jgi:hypothetical protein
MSEENKPEQQDQTEAVTEEATEERKMTPLERVKARQAALQKNRSAGARKASGRSPEAGPSDGPTQRVQIQRRSGGA